MQRFLIVWLIINLVWSVWNGDDADIWLGWSFGTWLCVSSGYAVYVGVGPG